MYLGKEGNGGIDIFAGVECQIYMSGVSTIVEEYVIDIFLQPRGVAMKNSVSVEAAPNGNLLPQ